MRSSTDVGNGGNGMDCLNATYADRYTISSDTWILVWFYGLLRSFVYWLYICALYSIFLYFSDHVIRIFSNDGLFECDKYLFDD